MKWLRLRWQALRARLQAKPTAIGDRLAWWEEIPLALALLAQSYVVGLWYYASIKGADPSVDLAVAIGAGLALDLIVVTTVMGRRQGRSSGWSWLTSLGAFGCSALIAIDRYGWEPHSLLHVAFPLVVFLYSQHLATPRKTALASAPERSRIAEWAELPTSTIAPNLAPIQAVALNGHANVQSAALERLTLVEPIAYECPHCKRSLKSKQALGAAVANGHCPACKAERKSA